MRLTKSGVGMAVANASLLALFPGFFFYHSAVGSGDFSAILGGYFSPIAIVATLTLLFFYVNLVISNRREFSPVDLAFFAFTAYFSLVVAMNFIDFANSEVTTHHAIAITHLLACFLTFRLGRFDSKWFRRALFIALIMMACIIFLNSVDGSFYLKQSGEGDTESVATYQGFSRSFLVAGVVLAAFTRNFNRRVAIYAICIPSLFLAIARSEFFGFIIFAFVFELLSSKRSVFALGITAIIGLLLYFSFDLLATLLPDNRVLSLIIDQSDSSSSARLDFTSQAIDTISLNPILGDYASYANDLSSGSYAHNILSAWVDLGVLGFLLLSFALISPVFFLMRTAKSKSEQSDRDYKFALAMIMMVVFLLITAKDFTYMLSGAALGACAAFIAQHRKIKAALVNDLNWNRQENATYQQQR